MKRVPLLLVCVFVLALGYLIYPKSEISASPAETIRDTGCNVTDADGIVSTDDDCKVHIAIKYDRDGNLQFFQYQDKGVLPPDAALPSKAMRSETFFDCNGCLFEGTYIELITPSGKYSSRGPY